MYVTLYRFFKKSNSTKRPTDSTTQEGVSNVFLKEDTSIYSPTFRLTPANPDIIYTYLKWDNYYYYINDIVKPTISNCWEYVCTLDPLATFRAEINQTYAYIKYCSTNYDITVPDDRKSYCLVGNTTSATKEVFVNELDTTITVQYISAKDSYYGSVATAIVTPDALRQLNALLMSEDFQSSLNKQIDSTASAIVGCKLFPIAINGDTTSTMNILGTDTSINCTLIKGNGLRRGTYTLLTNSDLLSDTWVGSGEYQRQAPYSTYKLYLPCYGYIDVSFTYLQELALRGKDFDISYIIDIINGSLTWVIWGMGKFDCSLAVNIPTAYSGINALSTISNGIDAGAGLIDTIFGKGSISGTAKASFNTAVSATQKICGTIGSSSGSMASIISDPNYHGSKDMHIELIKTSLKEVKNSNDLTAPYIGRPCNKIDVLSNHGEYVECVNASVANVFAPKQFIDEINDTINSGIFLE